MKEKRFYQRYAVDGEDLASLQYSICIDGEEVRLVDFSLGGLCFIAEDPEVYVPGDIVTISVNLENRGKIDLIGQVIRVTKSEDSCSVAIDLSHSYRMNSLHKI